MYENNYPNTYHYGNDSFNDASNEFQGGNDYPQPGNSGRPDKGHKEDIGFGRKILIGICCGLCFGIFAGLGFQAVNTASDLLKDKTGITQTQETSLTVEAVENPEESAKGDMAVKEEQDTEEPDTEEPDVEELKMDSTNMVQSTVMDVSSVVKEVMPAVVSVNNKFMEKLSFFGQEYSQEATGSGSGIIVGENETELLLVTNYHVVEAAEELTVQFVDGTLSQAQVKGTDEDKDLAVIAVQLNDIEDDTKSKIAIAELGSSDALEVGEPTIAIGNALGYGQSVTTGVVSALNRVIEPSVSVSYQKEDREINAFIQTDAAINPGNSGGPLLNIKGQVIGINSSKIGDMVVEGMGYAIPISDVQDIIENLMSKETRLKVDEAKRGYLGITGVNVVEEYVELYGAPQGVYISKVMEGSGAYDAGLIRGDIITAINGVEITSMSELQEELCYYEAGTTVEITIMQGSPTGYQAKNVEVTLGSQSR